MAAKTTDRMCGIKFDYEPTYGRKQYFKDEALVSMFRMLHADIPSIKAWCDSQPKPLSQIEDAEILNAIDNGKWFNHTKGVYAFLTDIIREQPGCKGVRSKRIAPYWWIGFPAKSFFPWERDIDPTFWQNDRDEIRKGIRSVVNKCLQDEFVGELI